MLRQKGTPGLLGGEGRGGGTTARYVYFSWLKESGNSKTKPSTGTRRSKWEDFASRSNHAAPAPVSPGLSVHSGREKGLISRSAVASVACFSAAISASG